MMVYFPDWQEAIRNMSLVIRTDTEPESLAQTVRRTVSTLDKQAAITSTETMRQIVAGSVAQQRFQTYLLAAFTFAALTLACLGIYGVLAFATGRRTPEIGIRMALGARPSEIFRAILSSGMAPVLTGVIVGLAISVAQARTLQSLLFQVRALDPLLYAVTLE